MSNPVPSSLALSTISGQMAASPVNSNYAAVQAAVNALITAMGGGSAGQKLEAVDSTHVQWTYPPGYEYSYVDYQISKNVTATTEATADTLATAAAVTFDGSTTVNIEFFAPYANRGTTRVELVLYDGAASIGILAWSTTSSGEPIKGSRRLTPAAATKTYSVRAFVDGGTGIVQGGAGGVGNFVPAYIKITKA